MPKNFQVPQSGFDSNLMKLQLWYHLSWILQIAVGSISIYSFSTWAQVKVVNKTFETGIYKILKISIFWSLWVTLSNFREIYFRRNHVSINTPLACFLRIHCNHRRWQALLWRGCHSPLCFELLPKKYKLWLNSKNRFRNITSATAG